MAFATKAEKVAYQRGLTKGRRLAKDIERRLAVLEDIAHEPFDFEALIKRLQRVEAAAYGATSW